MSDKTISAYLRAARKGEKTFFHKHREIGQMLERINSALTANAHDIGSRPLETLLMMNAHAQFLAAIRVATSGAASAVFPVLRAAQESALYGLLAAQSEENRMVWIQRADDKRAFRRIYSVEEACRYLDIHDPNLAVFARQHHEAAIEFGAHPNPKSILPALSFGDHDETRKKLTMTFLWDIESRQTAQNLVACVEAGILILFLARHALPESKAAVAAFEVGSALNETHVGVLESIGYRFGEDT